MAESRAALLDGIFDRWRPIALVLGGLVVLNAGVYFGIIRPIVRTSGNSEAILTNEQARADKIRSEVAGLERITSKLACTRSDVQRIFDETLSSKNERMTRIQREVRQLAKDRGLDPDAISYNVSTVKDTGLVRFGIAFPLDGPYATLQDFIKQVEASKNFLVVETIAMQDSQGPNLKLQIELATYFQAPDIDDGVVAAAPGGKVMSERLKLGATIAAFVVLGLTWWMFRGGGEAPAPPTHAAAGGAADPEAEGAPAPKAAKRAKRIEADDVPVIHKAVSKPLPGETFARDRSLFSYAQSPEELAEIKKAQDLMAAQRKQQEDDARKVAEENAVKTAEAAAAAAKAAELKRIADAEWIRNHPPKPVPPRFAYEYIGVVGPKDSPYAILRGPDQKLAYAKSGDVLDKLFRIERVAKFVLDLTYTDSQFAGEISQVQRTFEGTAAAPRH